MKKLAMVGSTSSEPSNLRGKPDPGDVMNTRLLARLLGLRYRLLWAQVRLRNGKIALFVVGYLFAMLIIAFLALAGYRAAMASIRLGKAELVASAVLCGFFLLAILASVILGIGINPAFSDAALRRYSLTPVDRLVARQLTAFLEPMWMCILAFDLGVAAGLYTFSGSAPSGSPCQQRFSWF